VRDGFANPKLERREVGTFIERLSELMRVTEIPLAHAAGLVEDAVRRTDALGVRLPKDVPPALKAFRRIQPEALPPWPATHEASPECDVQELLAEPHRKTWFFDEGDLSAARFPHAPKKRGKKHAEAWAKEVARAFDLPELRHRLVEMARHEARFLAWAGDAKGASLFTALGREVESRGIGDSRLGEAIVHASMDRMVDDAMERPIGLGDPVLRRSLRSDLFADVTRPTGRDLARLDFTEAVLSALDQELKQVLPGQRRPRFDDLRLAADRVGRIVAEQAIASVQGSRPFGIGKGVEQVIASTLNVDPEDAALLEDCVDSAAHALFVAGCTDCPVQCLSRPSARVEKAFFSDTHPAET
jgi:hypothetical protein